MGFCHVGLSWVKLRQVDSLASREGSRLRGGSPFLPPPAPNGFPIYKSRSTSRALTSLWASHGVKCALVVDGPRASCRESIPCVQQLPGRLGQGIPWGHRAESLRRAPLHQPGTRGGGRPRLPRRMARGNSAFILVTDPISLL